jgi:hypothetical protein
MPPLQRALQAVAQRVLALAHAQRDREVESLRRRLVRWRRKPCQRQGDQRTLREEAGLRPPDERAIDLARRERRDDALGRGPVAGDGKADHARLRHVAGERKGRRRHRHVVADQLHAHAQPG